MRPIGPRQSRSHRPDVGFTLVELVISTGLLGLVLSAIAAAMLLASKATAEGDARIGSSTDVQFASTRFGTDVSMANSVMVGGAALCRAPSDSNAVVQLINVNAPPTPDVRPPVTPTPTPTPAPAFTVSYVVRPGPSGQVSEFHRLECPGAGGTVAGGRDTILARRMANGVSPVVMCLNGPNSVLNPCPANPMTVKVVVTESDGSPPYELWGTRRTQ